MKQVGHLMDKLALRTTVGATASDSEAVAVEAARKQVRSRESRSWMAMFALLVLCACLDRAGHLMPLFWTAPGLAFVLGGVYFGLRHHQRLSPTGLGTARAAKSKRQALLDLLASGAQGALIVTAAVALGTFVDAASWWFHNRDLAKFEDDPQGFGFIRNLAKRDFGKLVLLNSPGASWANTMTLSQISSPASMSTDSGFCTLSISPAALRSRLQGRTDALRDLEFKGVLVHELAHCLDLSRDLWKGPGQPSTANALPPSTVAGVHDLESYLMAGRSSPNTGLWREAFADVFLVGYWRLKQAESAAALTAGLRAKRAADGAAGDADHSTVCWIDAAMKAAPPDSLAELVEWADTARRAPACGAL